MRKEELKLRKGDLTGEIEIICFPVVKHVKQCCKLTCLVELHPDLLASSLSFAPSGGLHYTNCGMTATPGPPCPGE